MTTVKIGPKGQIVIPKEVRKMFGFQPGDSVLLLADKGQGIAIQPFEFCGRILESSTDAEGKEKMNALTVSNLKKEYPCFHLKEVSFSCRERRIVGLIGRNGAGKTTILKSIMNLISSEGKIEYFGLPFRKNERLIKQKIGYVSGGFDFYPLKTLRLICKTVSSFYDDWNEQTYREYLERFSLDENKKVHDLSEGMKVKFSITLRCRTVQSFSSWTNRRAD